MTDRTPQFVPWWPFLVTTVLLVVLSLAVLLRPLYEGGASSAPATPQPTTAPAATGGSTGLGSLSIQADTVIGGTNLPQGDVSCTLNNRFPRSSEVVWRAAIVNPATGQGLDDSQIASVIVTLDDGQQFPMRFSGHPPNSPTTSFWATSWTIPDSYPTGIVHYTITATAADGRTAKWQPLNVDSSELTVTETNPSPAGA